MKNLKKKLILITILTLMLLKITFNNSFANVNSDAKTEIMKLSEIKIGMKGIGKTVVSGTKIEEFEIEILGILKNNKFEDALQISGSSILVKVSGEVILKSGGIAAGMSGSPVYINNKLVGAISSGWAMTDHTIGLVTPIEEMLELLRYINYNKKNKSKIKNINELIDDKNVLYFIDKSSKLANIDGIIIDNQNKLSPHQYKNYLVFKNTASPLFVSGLNERNYFKVKELFSKRNFNVINLSQAKSLTINNNEYSDDFEIKDLKPGHAISVQLVKGDINITTIGTLTYLKDNFFLAFAHSFMKQGDVSYFLSPVNIYHCFISHEMPFKIGVSGKPIGNVLVDRNEGIAGIIGKMPLVSTITVKVNDVDNDYKKNFSTQIVQNDVVFLNLLQTVLTQAVDEGINRIGKGFAKISYKLNGRSEKSGEFIIKRHNYFYDKNDIATLAISEIIDVVSQIISNKFEKAYIYDIEVSFDISTKNVCANVSKISLNNNNFKQGDTLEVSVEIDCDYAQTFTETFSVPIPLNLKNGEYNLVISNGNYTTLIDNLINNELSLKSSLEAYTTVNVFSFKDLVLKLNNQNERNNQIKVEFIPINNNLPNDSKSGNNFLEAVGLNDKIEVYNKLYNRLTYNFNNKLRPVLSDNALLKISELKSKTQYSKNYSENYKFYRNFEYIINSFNVSFNISIDNKNANISNVGNENFVDDGNF